MLLLRQFRWNFSHRAVLRFLATNYVQGQSPDPKIREYFYYIDHNGQLFLDDARMKNFTSCFKESKFLEFFFTRLRKNDTARYPDFPFLSLCGREHNFVRCEDTPIVFYQILALGQAGEVELLAYCNAGKSLSVNFRPEGIFMSPKSGRVYHPADEKFGGVGLVAWPLAIRLSKNLIFDEQAKPVKISWHNREIQLTNECAVALKLLNKI